MRGADTTCEIVLADHVQNMLWLLALLITLGSILRSRLDLRLEILWALKERIRRAV
jgi:hypothetical protein